MLAVKRHTGTRTWKLGSTWVGGVPHPYRAGTDGVPKPVQIAYPIETG